MDNFINLITKAWDKCEGSKCKQAVLIILALFSVVATIIVIYFYWWIIFFVCAVILYFIFDANEYKKMQALQKQQRTRALYFSVVYVLRHALTGLEHLFGIPSTPDKGFCGIVPRNFKSGVLFFDVFYSRLPNLSDDLILGECEQLREILNNRIQSIIGSLPFENVMPVDLYVAILQTKDRKLAIKVIPLIDDISKAEAEKFRRFIARNVIIGKTEENTAKIGSGKELVDDEL